MSRAREINMALQWFIIIVVMLIGVQMFLYSRFGLKKTEYTRYFSEPAVFEGEQVEMMEEIANRKVLPIPWLRLESRIHPSLKFQQQDNLDIAGEQFHRSLFSLLPYQKITRRHQVTCRKRGYYWMRTAAMTSGDFLGLAETNQTVEVSAELLVYPKLVSMDDMPLPSNSWQGDYSVRRWIVDDPFVLAGVREYASGDSLNMLNWKATARTGELQVNKNDYTTDYHLMIYINFDLMEDNWMPITNEPLLETAISYAASIAEYAISQGITTGFGCNAYLTDPNERVREIKEPVRIAPETGPGHLRYLWETMAKIKMDRSMNFIAF